MKSLIQIVLIIIGLFVVSIIVLLWDYIYYPLIESKAEERTKSYLKASFPEGIVIDDVTFSKPFGDTEGEYQITAHPKANPEIELYVDVFQNFSIDEKSFKESKWRYDTILEYTPLQNEISPDFSSYAVNISIPDELLENYPIETNYGDIRKLHENVTEEYLFMAVLIDRDFTEKRALEYGYRAVEFMKKRNLKDAVIEIDFYPRSLIESFVEKNPKFDVFDIRSEFIYEAIPYRVIFDTRNKWLTKTGLEEIKSPEDLKPFLIIDGPFQ